MGTAPARPLEQLLQRARQRLARTGLQLPHHLPPRGMARQARQQLGQAAEPAAQWLLRLEQARYAAHPTTALRQLRRELARLPWPVMGAQSRGTGTMTPSTAKIIFLIAASALSISATAKNHHKKHPAKTAPAPLYAQRAEAMQFADDLAGAAAWIANGCARP